MQLRPYQEEAIASIYHYLRTQSGNPCCVLPTGSGKTIVLSTICADAVRKWSGRVLILAHVKELLEQAKDKLALFCPDIPIGLYSAGLGEKSVTGSIIVAGIQSVYRRASELGRFDLIIIDEAHTLPEEGDGMYRQFLGEMKMINPQVRLLGLTATPYRMSSGTLCGPGKLLTDICCDIGVKELIAQGYLCPLVTKGSRTPLDYSSLHLRAGEFISSEVEEVVNTESNVQAACREIVERTGDRISIPLEFFR